MARHQPSPNDGRVMMVFAGILFIPMFGFFLWKSFFQAQNPQNLPELIGRAFLDEMLIVAMLFFTIGFLWGLTGIQKLKHCLDLTARNLARVLIVLVFIFIGIVIYYRFIK